MHPPVIDNLEACLQGRPCAEVDSHLASCSACSQTLNAMKRQSALIQSSLRVPSAAADIEPLSGFYARVVRRIESERKPSFWSLLLDPIFGKRLMYGSLAAVILMGAYLAAIEPVGQQMAFGSPEAILSEPHNHEDHALGANPQRDRDVVLVNLATYSE